MPNWQLNWSDVRWNQGAADAASSSLRRSAENLEQTASERSRVADDAKAEWRGKHRDSFDILLSQMLSEASSLAQQCREVAARIDGASRQAYEEQRRREAERDRWRREKEAEERAKRQR